MTQKINVFVSIAASVQKAWDCYTLPEHITQWNFAHPSWHCPSATNDLRVGGKLEVRMEAKDGSFGFDFSGIYDSISPQKSLAYTMSDGRKVEVIFTPNEEQTDVEVSFDPEQQNPEELQREGWQAILNNFKDYTEKA